MHVDRKRSVLSACQRSMRDVTYVVGKPRYPQKVPSSTMTRANPHYAKAASLQINNNGGALVNGRAYGIEKKIELADRYGKLPLLATGKASALSP